MAQVRVHRAPCCRCGQRIDYDLDYPDPDAFTVDHFPHAWSTHPELAEDSANLAAAHARCNWNAGDKPPKPSLGRPPEQW